MPLRDLAGITWKITSPEKPKNYAGAGVARLDRFRVVTAILTLVIDSDPMPGRRPPSFFVTAESRKLAKVILRR